MERQLLDDRDLVPLADSLPDDVLSEMDRSPSRASTARIHDQHQSTNNDDPIITIKQQRLIGKLRNEKVMGILCCVL